MLLVMVHRSACFSVLYKLLRWFVHSVTSSYIFYLVYDAVHYQVKKHRTQTLLAWYLSISAFPLWLRAWQYSCTIVNIVLLSGLYCCWLFVLAGFLANYLVALYQMLELSQQIRFVKFYMLYLLILNLHLIRN